MAAHRTLPDDPLAFIQECVRRDHLLWTFHVSIRLARRFIAQQTILDAVNSYEIVEAYPEDKYLPSYLVLARNEEESFHVLFAADVSSNHVRVIIAYRPDSREWHEDLRTRRTTT